MRNLKRALSLTLASVMLLGMMVVGTSAASFPDVTAEDNVEAIEVLAAVKVLQGRDDGSFDPTATVTRNEMATIICRMMGWRDGDFAGLNPFPDVPAWASNYVAACVANGIINGRDDGRFHGDDTVTATEAASMMLRALGYTRMPVGADWARAVAQQASKISLFDGLDVGAYDAMSRGDVSQLALNSLESAMVEVEDNTLSIDAGNGVSISGGQINYVVVTSSKNYAKAISDAESSGNALNGVNGPIVELGEHVFNGDLKKIDSTDNFGAPATRWTYKNVEVGTYANGEDYKFEGIVKSEAMYNAVGKTAAEDYRWVVKMDGTTAPKKANGDAQELFTGADVAAKDTEDLNGTVRGSTTYVYLDDDAVTDRNGNMLYKGTATVCIVNTYAAEVIKVENGTITLGDMNDSSLKFDINGYAEDDVVLYTKSINSAGDWNVENILGKAELVEGEADTIRNADRVVIGDTTYRYSYRFNDDKGAKLNVNSVDEAVAFYLDKQGNIIRLEDASESNDYAYVYSVGNASSRYGDDAEYGAKLIFTDGKTRNVDIEDDTTDDILKAGNKQSASDPDKLTYVKGKLEGQIVSYSQEEDGTYSLDIKTTHKGSWNAKVEDVLKAGASRVNLTGNNYTTDTNYTASTNVKATIYANQNSAILINEPDDDNDEFEVYTGYANLPNVDTTSSSSVVAYVDKGVIRALYIMDVESSGSEKDVIFVKGQNNQDTQGTGSNRYFVYTAYVDGEVRDIFVKEGSDAATTLEKVKKGQIGVYFGISENSSGYVTKLTTDLPSDVAVNGVTSKNNNGLYAAYVGVRSAENGLLGFDWDNTNNGYKVRPSTNDDIQIVYMSKGDTMTVKSSISNNRDAAAYVVTDDGEVIAVLIDEGGLPGGQQGGNQGGNNPPSSDIKVPDVSGEEINGFETIAKVNEALKDDNVIINGIWTPTDLGPTSVISIPAGRTLKVGGLDLSSNGKVGFANKTSTLIVDGALKLNQDTIDGVVYAGSLAMTITSAGAINADVNVTNGNLTVTQSKNLTVAKGVNVIVKGDLMATSSGTGVLTNYGHIEAKEIKNLTTVNELSASSIVAEKITVTNLNVGDADNAGKVTVSNIITVPNVTVTKGTVETKDLTSSATLTVKANNTVTINGTLDVKAVAGEAGAKVTFGAEAKPVVGDAKDMFQASSGASSASDVADKTFTWGESSDNTSNDDEHGNAFVDKVEEISPIKNLDVAVVDSVKDLVNLSREWKLDNGKTEDQIVKMWVGAGFDAATADPVLKATPYVLLRWERAEGITTVGKVADIKIKCGTNEYNTATNANWVGTFAESGYFLNNWGASMFLFNTSAADAGAEQDAPGVAGVVKGAAGTEYTVTVTWKYAGAEKTAECTYTVPAPAA